MLSVSKRNSSGFDEVPCSLLKHIVEYIIYSLTILDRKFPSKLKSTIVIQPTFKKRNIHNISIYRGIYNVTTCFFRKPLKKLSTTDHSYIVTIIFLTSSSLVFRKVYPLSMQLYLFTISYKI